MHYTIDEIERAVLNRLVEYGYTDADIEAMGVNADSFLEGFTLDTIYHADVQALAGMQMAGIGSSIKKALKKAKKAVKKVVSTVNAPIRAITNKVSDTVKRKLLPDNVEDAVNKIEDKLKPIVKVLALPVTAPLNMMTINEMQQTFKEGTEVLQRTFVPDHVYQKAKEFEQKHRPLIKEIVTTVASIVASVIMGPAALTFMQVAMEAAKQLALNIALEKVATRVAEIKAKRDSKEVAKEMEAIQREVDQMQADILAQMQTFQGGQALDIIFGTLTPDVQAKVRAGLATNGPAWIDTPEAQQLIGPAVTEMSAAIAAMSSDNVLAPIAAIEVAQTEAKPQSPLLPLGIGALLLLMS